MALAVSAGLAAASASAASPWWHLVSTMRPAVLAPGGEGTIVVQAVNLGDAAITEPVTLSDALPANVSVAEVEGVPQVTFLSFAKGATFDMGTTGPLSIFKLCSASAAAVSCTTPPAGFLGGFLAPLPEVKPYEDLEIRVKVKLGPSAVSGEDHRASVSGGEAPAMSLKRPIAISEAPSAFAAEDFSLVPEEEGGEVDAQAGSHPFQLSATFSLDQSADPLKPPALARNLRFKLPSGLIGNATAIPQCSELDFTHLLNGGSADECPESTVVGVASITIDEPVGLELQTIPVPLFNLTPGAGEPARFGFEYAGSPVTLDTSVRTGSDYGVTVSVSNITQVANFLSTTVTFWGAPGDPRHDHSRGWGCLVGGHFAPDVGCVLSKERDPRPFLTLPTSCTEPFEASVEGESWPTQADPAGLELVGLTYSLKDEFERPLTMTGCNQLPFNPSIEVQPDVRAASTPTGLTVHVRVPQEVSQNAGGLASSSLKNITVALPDGVAVNSAGAGGLEACSEPQIGFQKVDSAGTDLFTSGLPSPFCPKASKIGTVKITLPVVAHPLEGAVYLASQNANPFGSLLAMYVVAEDPVSGVLIKLAGDVHLTATGQLITTFSNSPQGPLEEAEFHFFGGSRAPLSTPAHCGDYTTEASFVPWAAEPADETALTRSASTTFEVNSGPGGGPCPGASLPFSPTITGGTTNIAAGAFSPLTTVIGRADGNQDMQSVQLQMPPGLSGILAGVKLCPETQANEGTCGAESQIGETTVSAGLGNEPVSVTGGKVYITEKYAGAPFGLSIVNPVKTGPFDLEHDTSNPNQSPACDCLVVRGKVEVDPRTAALTITTDSSGAHVIPHLIDGVPVQIKHVNVMIDRPGFTFNPTNCDPQAITGQIGSVQGTFSPVSVPFQVTNCAALTFQPKLTVTTKGRASRLNGQSLSFKIAYPKGAMGHEAWFKEAKFELPKQLPARLPTLRQACLAATFEHNRGACPVHSVIGHAVVHTPVLPVPLEGPVYFVSYGGAAFPDAVLVLDGYGVHIELHGNTFINNRTGITSATFRNTPDVPFESIEVSLPAGQYSEFGSNLPHESYDFCGRHLVMPTLFKAQNGLEIHQNTNVAVTGCGKAKTRAQLLAAALMACHKKHGKNRASCETAAKHKYGARASKPH